MSIKENMIQPVYPSRGLSEGRGEAPLALHVCVCMSMCMFAHVWVFVEVFPYQLMNNKASIHIQKQWSVHVLRARLVTYTWIKFPLVCLFYNHIPNICSVKTYPITQRKEAIIYSYIYFCNSIATVTGVFTLAYGLGDCQNPMTSPYRQCNCK